MRHGGPILLALLAAACGAGDGTPPAVTASPAPGSTPDDAGADALPAPDLRLGARVDAARGVVRFRVWSARATRIEVDVYAAPLGEDERVARALTKDEATAIWSIEIPLREIESAGVRTIYYGY